MTTIEQHDELARLIARVEYLLDPTASAPVRLQRRAHLTNHDLRTILTTLRQPNGATQAASDTRLREDIVFDFSDAVVRDILDAKDVGAGRYRIKAALRAALQSTASPTGGEDHG